MLIAAIVLVLALVLSVALQVEDWSRDLTTNYAATSATAGDPLLRTTEFLATAEQVQTAVQGFVQATVAWSTGEPTSDTSSIALVRTSPLFRFADDVTVILEPTATGTRVDVTSQSRVGKGDLGQNPRNIRQLLQALHDRLPTKTAADL